MPPDHEATAHYLLEEGNITKQNNGLYGITHMEAILLAKRLSKFPSLSRKSVRVIQYETNDRLSLTREKEFSKDM